MPNSSPSFFKVSFAGGWVLDKNRVSGAAYLFLYKSDCGGKILLGLFQVDDIDAVAVRDDVLFDARMSLSLGAAKKDACIHHFLDGRVYRSGWL